ncbi:MAG: hypothetical protein HYX62_05120 [Gammaproteobacteria bacterium]|nr:hypothetical protein [Gammaproteobacteria bacterium]
MDYKWLISMAVALELASWGTVAAPWHPALQAISFAMPHAGASALLAVVLQRLLPTPYREPRSTGLLCLFSIGFFIPFLGALGLFTTTLLALYLPKRTRIAPWEVTQFPDLPYRPLVISPQPLYGEGGLAAVLRHAADPDKRHQAVMATRHMRDQEAIPILRLALKDAVDDVRLLAYSMLSGKEQVINARIKEQLSRLQQEADAALRTQLHHHIAQDYWELAYLGLAEGEVLIHVLNTAREHVEAALELRTDAPGLHFLRGRILLHQGHIKGARDAFTKAQSVGLPAVEVLPYLAEVAFRERRFQDVRAALRALDPLARTHPTLSGVADYWR